jgi:hypothetical protein
MEYKAQLVVRAKTPEGVATINKVKELAEAEGKTYSAYALEILQKGLGDGAVETKPAPEPAAPEPEPEPVTPEPKPVPTPTQYKSNGGLVGRVVELQEVDTPVAISELAGFIQKAEPAEVHKMKSELSEAFGAERLAELMDTLKKTPQYKSYKQRVIYGD